MPCFIFKILSNSYIFMYPWICQNKNNLNHLYYQIKVMYMKVHHINLVRTFTNKKKYHSHSIFTIVPWLFFWINIWSVLSLNERKLHEKKVARSCNEKKVAKCEITKAEYIPIGTVLLMMLFA